MAQGTRQRLDARAARKSAGTPGATHARAASASKPPRPSVTDVASELGMAPRQVARIARALGVNVEKLALSGGAVVGPGGSVSQWWTPEWLAKAFVRWARIDAGMSVLDAGAGMGSLTATALDAGARVTAVELDPRLVEQLRTTHLEGPDFAVVHRDFLAASDPRQLQIPTGHGFDVAISNPPWEADYCERFLARMLDHAPRACGIVPLNMLAGVERARSWAWLEVRRVKVLPRRANFGGPGGGKRDVMLIEVVARSRPRAPGDVDRCELEVGE